MPKTRTNEGRVEMGLIEKRENKSVEELEKDLIDVIACLDAYEDTGLTPEQIRKLKDRDTAKAPKHAPTGYGMICPICGNLVQVWQKHCGWCGQKLRED